MENSFNDTDNQLDNIFNINIDQEGQQYLKTASSWARLIAILGFIGAGVSVVTIFITRKYSGGTIFLSGGGLVIAIILNIFLIRFANKMSSGLSNTNIAEFDEGINNLRTYFKAFGIIMIVALSLAILGIFIYIVSVASSSF